MVGHWELIGLYLVLLWVSFIVHTGESCYLFRRLDSGEKKEEKSTKTDNIKQIDVGKEAAIEAEVKAARERAVIPLEIRMKQFRDMLAEKEVRKIHLECWSDVQQPEDFPGSFVVLCAVRL